MIGWHRRGLLPDAAALTSDARVTLVEADFFAVMRGDQVFTDTIPERFHAILLDVDHSPRNVLHPSHAPFYMVDGLTRLRHHLTARGVFALWSDDPPDDDLLAALDAAGFTATAEIITFPNPLTRGQSAATIYVAST